jgi:hypothetical protein
MNSTVLVSILTTSTSNVMALRQKERISDTNWARLRAVGNAAEALGLRSMCGSDLVGNLMKNAITAHLRDEHFIIRVDGRVKSHHRPFLGCTSRRLAARDQFPQHEVKVCAQASSELHLAMTG